MSITAAPVAVECGVPDVSPLTIFAPVAYSRRPRWIGPALWTLLGVTALLYLWDLSASGYANEFYAASVQAGTQSWKALLFGSLDPGNAITVDKPPAAIWVMGLSARLFGFNAWAMLVPQALMGVGAVALLYGAVRRASGPIAGLLAGAMLALTPLAALVFRYNDPDALLVLLLVAAGYCTVRALDGSSGRWLALAGTALGFAFLTKTMEACVVMPAIGLVVLVGGPGSVRTRIGNLLIGLTTTVISAGWFVALVAIWPAGSRPYIGGSTDNSLLQLALADNGVGRVLGGDGWRVAARSPGCCRRPDRPDRNAVVHPSRAADQPDAREPAVLGCLDVGVGLGLQLPARHHTPVLHRRDSTRHRGGHRHLCSRALARKAVRVLTGNAGPDAGGDRRMGLRPASAEHRTGCRGHGGRCCSGPSS